MDRATVHYGATVLTLAFYGGQVCPFIDTLSISTWSGALIVFFLAAYALQWWMTKQWVDVADPLQQSTRQLKVDALVFLSAGISLAVFNFVVFDFPFGSGVKVILGCVAMGMFAAIDRSLARERLVVEKLDQSGSLLTVARGEYYPLTSKFSLWAISCTVLMASIIALLMARDMEFLSKAGPSGLVAAQRAVIIELIFVSVVFLVEMTNIILSFSKNLKIKLSDQNETLIASSRGDFNRKVIVHTADEFGEMGGLTNAMIDSLKMRTDELKLTRDVSILALASLAETRDNETGAHILRTQHYLKRLAEKLRYHDEYKDYLDDDETIDLLFKSAPLHDIGKVGIPDAILLKEGKLTDEEFITMRLHAQYGHDAIEVAEQQLGSNSFLRFGREIAYTHHEKWDGSGYPRGLRGLNIPISGRLMAVVDVYDALVSKRVYKPALTHEKTIEILQKDAGTHFDPTIIEAFLEIIDDCADIQVQFKDLQDGEAIDFDPREQDN